eukprot:SAG31_NODE_47438_length_243_cov_5.277778_1_plen_69_part_10
MNHLDINIYCTSDPYPGQPIALVPAIDLRFSEYRYNTRFSNSSAQTAGLQFGLWVEIQVWVPRSEIPRE